MFMVSVMQGYPGHDVIFRVPKFYFSKVHSNGFTMRYHTPLSAAESPRGVLGRARPNIKLKHAKQGGDTKKRGAAKKVRQLVFEGSL